MFQYIRENSKIEDDSSNKVVVYQKRPPCYVSPKWRTRRQMALFLQEVELGDVIEIDRGSGCFYHTVVCVDRVDGKLFVVHLFLPDHKPSRLINKLRRIASLFRSTYRCPFEHKQARQSDGSTEIFVQITEFENVLRDNNRFRINNSADAELEPSALDEVFARVHSSIQCQERGALVEYSSVSYNCEHFTTWCRYGVERSLHVEVAASRLCNWSSNLDKLGKVLMGIGTLYIPLLITGGVCRVLGAALSALGNYLTNPSNSFSAITDTVAESLNVYTEVRSFTAASDASTPSIEEQAEAFAENSEVSATPAVRDCPSSPVVTPSWGVQQPPWVNYSLPQGRVLYSGAGTHVPRWAGNPMIAARRELIRVAPQEYS